MIPEFVHCSSFREKYVYIIVILSHEWGDWGNFHGMILKWFTVEKFENHFYQLALYFIMTHSVNSGAAKGSEWSLAHLAFFSSYDYNRWCCCILIEFPKIQVCSKSKHFFVLGQTSFFSPSLLLQCILHFPSLFYQLFLGFKLYFKIYCLFLTSYLGFWVYTLFLILSTEFRIFRFLCNYSNLSCSEFKLSMYVETLPHMKSWFHHCILYRIHWNISPL